MSITLRLPNRKKQKFLIGALYKYYHKILSVSPDFKNVRCIFAFFGAMYEMLFLGEDFGGVAAGFINNRAQKLPPAHFGAGVSFSLIFSAVKYFFILSLVTAEK